MLSFSMILFFHAGEEIYLIVRRVKKIFSHSRERERECVCKEKKKNVRAGDNVRGRIRGIGIEEGRAILMLLVLARSFAYRRRITSSCLHCVTRARKCVYTPRDSEATFIRMTSRTIISNDGIIGLRNRGSISRGRWFGKEEIGKF